MDNSQTHPPVEGNWYYLRMRMRNAIKIVTLNYCIASSVAIDPLHLRHFRIATVAIRHVGANAHVRIAIAKIMINPNRPRFVDFVPGLLLMYYLSRMWARRLS